MPKVTLLVGVPASGKSTYVDNTIYNNPDANSWVVSTDIIIQEICDIHGITYNEGFADLIKFAEKIFFSDIEKAIDRKIDVVIDRTNLTVKGRRKFINMFKPAGYEIEAIVFPIPEQNEWERRLTSRPGKTIPDHVIQGMVSSYTRPTIEEGFDCVRDI